MKLETQDRMELDKTKVVMDKEVYDDFWVPLVYVYCDKQVHDLVRM